MRPWQIKHIVLIVALAFFALAAWLFARRVAAFRSGGSVEGMITGFERREIDESVSYHPMVSFVDHAGVGRHFTSPAGYSQPRPLVGTKVRVRYLHSAPELAFIGTFFHMWAAPVGFVVLGLGAFAVWLEMS